MAFWDTLKSVAEKNAAHYVYAFIPDPQGIPLTPHAAYFRLWLTEMYLAKSRKWFTEWYPAVHSTVQLKLAGVAPVTLPHVARPPDKQLGRGVLHDYALTDLLPYRGGVVQIQAALLALKGTDYISASLKILENFTVLVHVPLAESLQVAQGIVQGVEELMNATDGNVHLVLHEALISEGGGGDNVLQPGYIVVMLAEAKTFDKERFSVSDQHLQYDGKLVDDIDYFLLRIETRTERDDWALPYIEDPLNKACEALVFGDNTKAATFRNSLTLAVLQSSDLTDNDKRRVLQAVKQRLESCAAGLGATGDVPTLESIAVQGLPPIEITSQGELTVDEALHLIS